MSPKGTQPIAVSIPCLLLFGHLNVCAGSDLVTVFWLVGQQYRVVTSLQAPALKQSLAGASRAQLLVVLAGHVAVCAKEILTLTMVRKTKNKNPNNNFFTTIILDQIYAGVNWYNK